MISPEDLPGQTSLHRMRSIPSQLYAGGFSVEELKTLHLGENGSLSTGKGSLTLTGWNSVNEETCQAIAPSISRVTSG